MKPPTWSILMGFLIASPAPGQVPPAQLNQTGLGDSTTALASGGGAASGTLSVSLRLEAGGVDITPLAAPSVSTTIQPAAPVITNTQVARTSKSVIIAVTGYATDPEVTQAVFTLGAASGQTLQSAAPSITLDVSTLFGNWFGSSDLGGEFLFTQPSTITGDPTQALPLTVTLVNCIGSVTANINP